MSNQNQNQNETVVVEENANQNRNYFSSGINTQKLELSSRADELSAMVKEAIAEHPTLGLMKDLMAAGVKAAIESLSGMANIAGVESAFMPTNQVLEMNNFENLVMKIVPVDVSTIPCERQWMELGTNGQDHIRSENCFVSDIATVWQIVLPSVDTQSETEKVVVSEESISDALKALGIDSALAVSAAKYVLRKLGNTDVKPHNLYAVAFNKITRNGIESDFAVSFCEGLDHLSQKLSSSKNMNDWRKKFRPEIAAEMEEATEEETQSVIDSIG